MLWSFVREDITPPVGLWQDGFANRAHPSDGVLDPLMLRVAATKSDQSAFVFLALEVLVLTNERADTIRRSVSKACGLAPHQVLVASTHTHSAPMSAPTEHEEDYAEWWESVSGKAAAAAERAFGSMRPARFDVVGSLSRIGVGRREFTERGVMIGESPKAVIDRNLRMLRVVDEDGKLLGAILQGACHAICMRERNTKYTGDWPGRACRNLEEQYQNAVILYFNGGSGDVNPKRYEGESDEECLTRTTDTFLEDVGRLMKKDFDPHEEGDVVPVGSELNVPLIKPRREDLLKELEEWRTRMAATPDGSWDRIIGVYCGRFVENALQHLEDKSPFHISAMVQAVRLAGDVAFFALPFEVFSATSRGLVLSLKDSGIHKENVFTIGYANGIHGYLPTAKALREGGYEARMSAWFYGLPSYYSPRAEREVRNRLLALWEETKTIE